MRNQPFFDLLFEIEFSIYFLINFRLKPIINLKMQSPSTFLQTAANYVLFFMNVLSSWDTAPSVTKKLDGGALPINGRGQNSRSVR